METMQHGGPQGKVITRVALIVAASLLAATCSGSLHIELADPAVTPGAGVEGSATPGAPGPDSILSFTAPDPSDTPLPVDDDVRVGTLDNGLTYYVRHNEAPGSSFQLRLVVNAGSMQQDIADSGHAHFLEHMLFNGTAKFPDNTLDDVLRSFGLAFGADLNAYTGYDETVYILSVPRNDGDSIDTAFSVLREWAGEATISQAQVEAERGVVAEEARLSSGHPSAPIDEAFDIAYTQRTAYEGRSPIGSDPEVASTDADELRQFYSDWYRPQLMAVIAVGDVPVDRFEREIVERFSDLADPLGAPIRDTPAVDVLTEAHIQVLAAPDQAQKFTSIDFSLPPWDQSTVGGERLSIIETLMGTMIGSGLAEGATRGDNNLIDPFAGPFAFNRSRAFFGFNADADDLAEGTAHILREMHRLRVTGFTRDQLDRATSTLRTGLEAQRRAQETEQDFAYAGLYVADFLDGQNIGAFDDTFDRLDRLLESLTIEDVTNHLRWMMATSAPIVILVAASPDNLPTEAELARIVADSEAEGLDLAGVVTPEVEMITSLMTPPDSVEPIDEGSVPSADGSKWWRFANGVTAIFVPSRISAGHVEVYASAGGGWSLLPATERPLTQIAADAVVSSGTGTIGRASLDRFLADSTAFAFPYIDQTREGFVAGADTHDLETAVQLIHLLITDPAIDATGMRSALAAAEDEIRAAETNPDAILFSAFLDAAYGGDPHQTALVATRAQLDDLDPESLLSLYESRLGKVDDLVVVFVGDTNDDTVHDLASAYLGTLPTGPADTWRDTEPPVRDGVERVVRHGASESPGGLLLSYSIEADVDLGMIVAGEILVEALTTRINDSVRERFGASYGGSAFFETVFEPDELARIFVLISGDPDRMDLIAATIQAEIDDLLDNGIGQIEMRDTSTVVRSRYDFIDNGYHLDHALTWAEHPEQEIDYSQRGREALAIDATHVDALSHLLFGQGARVQVLRVSET